MKARIKFRKYGVLKFIGHLDVMRFFQKAMRRADIPIAFTGGYSPHMIMSFAQPLGVGITSEGEYLDIELTERISSKEAVTRLNQVMVPGIDIVSFVEISEDKKAGGMTITAASDYRVYLLESSHCTDARIPIPEKWRGSIPHFLGENQIIVWKKTKKSEKEVDILPLIYKMYSDQDSIYLLLATGSEQNLKPDLVMEAFLNYIGEPSRPFHYHRLDIHARKEDGTLVPLSEI
ncbi:MAG: DUF2344 domain-containing protein [Dorea sp.]|nr:DUF2344 domain-containing protein [Dorea sp.]